MKQLILFLCILPTFTFSQFCTSDNRFSEIPFFTENQISSQYNLNYAQAIDWEGNNEILKFDVHYPRLDIDPLAKRPLILLIHGGGLISGDKSNYTNVCKEFAKRGFVAATINYRLGRDCNLDNQSEEKARYRVQQDVNAALRYIVHNASSIGIDTTWLFVGGGSAGSGAALATVYISQNEWNEFSPNMQLLLGDLISSGNNLTHSYRLRGVFNDWGATLKESVQIDEMLPMVSFHGDADQTVSIDSSFGGGCLVSKTVYGSRSLHNLLIDNGFCSDLSVRPGGGHGVYQDSAGVIFRVGRAACFFKSLFCDNCNSNSQFDSIPASCNSTNELLQSEQIENFKVFPNPFTDKLSVSTFEEIRSFTLLNQYGQVVFSGKEIHEQSLKDIKIGVYFLIISTTNNCITYKIMKE